MYKPQFSPDRRHSCWGKVKTETQQDLNMKTDMKNKLITHYKTKSFKVGFRFSEKLEKLGTRHFCLCFTI